jgi:flagellar motility protein MotE (MotC chaperone)
MTATQSEQLIKCPKCSHEFKVSETIAATIAAEIEGKYEQRLANLRNDISGRERTLKEAQEQLDKDRESADQAVAAKLKTERETISAAAKKKATLEFEVDLEQKKQEVKDLEALVKEKNEKLTEAQETQAQFLKKTRELGPVYEFAVAA